MRSGAPDLEPAHAVLLVHLPEEAALATELGEAIARQGLGVERHEIERLPIADPLAALLGGLAGEADVVAVVVPSRHRNVDWLVRELDMQNRMRLADPRPTHFVAVVTGTQRTWRMLLSNVVLELRRPGELGRIVDGLIALAHHIAPRAR